MKFRYIADTYAWIAYFNKKRFQQIIEIELIETPAVVIAEVAMSLKKKKICEEMIGKLLGYIASRGFILPLDFEAAKNGGLVAEKEGLPLIDGIIYSYIVGEECRLITGDEHFKNKPNVIFEKE
jgi:predicted nucleic acid-binding protein